MRSLYHKELEELVRWFLHNISQETRGKLMGELPVHYKLLYPDVDTEIITRKVEERINQVAAQPDPIPVGRY